MGLRSMLPSGHQSCCSRGAPYVDCMHHSVVAELMTVGTLVGRAGPWPG